MSVLCTAEHVDAIEDCPHGSRMFYAMSRDRGRFLEAIWVCEQCLHRVDPPGRTRAAAVKWEDTPLFEMESTDG